MTDSDMISNAGPDTPIVCTMPDEDAGGQIDGWADLQARAHSVNPIASGVRMTFPASMVDQVRDLMLREASCCAFLNFEIAVDAEIMVFEVTAPNPDAIAVIEALAGQKLS